MTDILGLRLDDCGGCQPSAPSTPQLIYNRSGLSAIQYRVGTFVTFKQAMLEAIPDAEVEVTGSGGVVQILRPLQNWTARNSDDLGIALLDMWAYIADILTFYQERIANEAYLSTALLEGSLRRLAALLDYHPAPGVAATVYLAFTLEAPTPSISQVKLRPGLRVQHKPGQDEKPQKFETMEERIARHEWNRLLPVLYEAQQLATDTEELYLEGSIATIRPGDAIVVVGDERDGHPEDEKWDFRIVQSVEPHRQQTKLRLDRSLGDPWTGPAQRNPKVYVFRRRASLFGYNAPDWNTLPVVAKLTFLGIKYNIKSETIVSGGTTTTTTSIVPDTTNPNWDPGHWPNFDNRLLATTKQVDLDSEYPKIVKETWVLLAQGPRAMLYCIEATNTVSRTDFDLKGKVTRLTLDSDRYLGTFGLRETVVYAEPQQFELGRRPCPEQRLMGRTILVQGDQTGLEIGRPILLVGRDGANGPAEGNHVSEIAFLAATRLVESDTELEFNKDLAHAYNRYSAEVYANVARSTHGETVSEVLGDGDGSQAFQTFKLKKHPVTFVPQAGAPNGAASTLEMRVNDLLWKQVPTLYGHGGTEQVYTAPVDEKGQMIVRAGDGATGRRLPSGRGNVTAVYRQGLGRAGNVPADTIQVLLDRPPGVKGVTNPMPAQGGAEPESSAMVRANAANTVRTFGRIVSLRDMEDAAREFAGVAKARASIQWSGEEEYIRLTIAGDEGAQIAQGTPVYDLLLADLNSRRDPNRDLRVESYVSVPVVLSALVYIDTPTYLADRVLEAIREAILAYFSFDYLNLGQSVYLSDIYRVMHSVGGVLGVDVERFGFKDLVVPPGPELFAFIRAQRARGVTFTTQGGVTVAAPIQQFAGARSNELIVLADSNSDLTLGEADRSRL